MRVLRSAVGVPYTRLFETFIEGEAPPFLKGHVTAPRPFVIEAEEERRQFAPGDRLRFDLLPSARPWSCKPSRRSAVARMAKRPRQRRLRFAVEEIAFLDAAGTFQPLVAPGRPSAPPLLPSRNGLPKKRSPSASGHRRDSGGEI